jgi:gliding motility-associated-like protein
MVNAWPLPKANFEYSPAQPVEKVDPVLFTSTSTGINLSQWSWYFTGNSDSSNLESPSRLYQWAGIYPVALVVKNKWGCADTIVKTVTIIDDFSFFVPNTFTPNGDGINDVFQPKGVGVIKYQLDVFDRWGEKIFTSTDFFTGWDGTFKGKLCKTDVYAWKILLTNPSGKIKNFEGYVNLND